MPVAGGTYYELHGPEDGEVVVLSPGLGGSASYWKPNLAALSAQYRVLLYDHIGTGRSGHGLPEAVNIDSISYDIQILMEMLGIRRAHFVGHALGGLIGLQTAFQSDFVEKLVIVNGWAELDPHTRRCFDVRLALLRDSGPAAFVRAQPLFLYPADWISRNDALLEVEAAHQLAHFPPIENIERRIGALFDWSLWKDRANCASILVIGTEDDMLVPCEASRRLAAGLPQSGFRAVQWGGHACNVTDPETFNRIVLDFLRS
ncbi:MAG TPA: pyrimidine utilization protein D [Sphingomonas sp.]|nr:pyrimidine utilization protein D [Sphingomonas sp.]